MNILRRLKNLWALSAYKVDKDLILKKDFSTVKKQLATIIPPERPDYFKQEDD